MKVVFPYIAQPHHIPHSFPLAAELASRPDFEVHIACTTDAQEKMVRRLLPLYPQARLQIDRLRIDLLGKLLQYRSEEGVPRKSYTLISNRSYFKAFDAAVVAERTSLVLRKLRLPRLRLIWTNHGAPGRAITYAPDIHLFDFVLLAGVTQAQRLLAEGQIRPGHYHSGCYAKFDLVSRLDAAPPPLFAERRPTVLYSPHFDPELSSWPKLGFAVLDHFAASPDYNLIFAPHIRLFDHHREDLHRQLDPYRKLPNLCIDTGSDRSIDMTYTQAADIYLGDVSSQICEFLVRPRPCIFLNAHQADWRTSPDYLFWHTGPVLEQVSELPSALARAQPEHGRWLQAQRDFFSDTFSTRFDAEGKAEIGNSAAAGAAAIADFLQRPA